MKKLAARLVLSALVFWAAAAGAEDAAEPSPAASEKGEPFVEGSTTEESPPAEPGGLFGLFRKGWTAGYEPAATAAPTAPVAEAAAPPAPEVTPTDRVDASGVGLNEAAAPPAPEVTPPPLAAEEPSAAGVAEPGVTPSLEHDLRAAESPAEESAAQPEIELPTVDIQGEIEKPEIFFLVPRARDHSDEQMIRARIRREITRPLIKEWLEEELLLK